MNMHPLLIAGPDAVGNLLVRHELPARSDADEETLQRLLFAHPELLALDTPNAPQLIPLAREVPIDGGRIDNLYVSTAGRLTVVETKLIKNPQATREVISQIIGYAASLARLDYAELNDAIADANRGRNLDAILSERIADAAARDACRSRLARSLVLGDFELLIVGDRVSEQALLATQSIVAHPSLQFRLSLVELRIYRLGEGTWPWIVVPRLIERVEPIERFVVRVENASEAVRVSVEPSLRGAATDDTRSRSQTFTDADDFFRSPDLKAGFADLLRTFEVRWIAGGGEARHSARLLRWIYIDQTGAEHWPLNVGTGFVNLLRPEDAVDCGLSEVDYRFYRDAIARVPAADAAIAANKTRVWSADISMTDLSVILELTLALLSRWRG